MSILSSRIRKLEKIVSEYNDFSNELPDPEFLKGSLIEFTKYFYKLRTSREFQIRPAENRQSFMDMIVPELEKTLVHDPINKRLIIRCPPRYGKTEIVIHYIAWALANYPDSSFIYVSYNYDSAVKNTKTIKRIITLPEYQALFGIKLSGDSRASDNFDFNTGGSIVGVGAEGTITGRGAGIPDVDRYGGAIIIDDIHKPSEVTSEKSRRRIKDWWFETLSSRPNNPKTPVISIGQALHEDDLIENLINGMDVDEWNPLVIPALDSMNNALMPAMHTSEKLLDMKEKMPYVFASQYQQTPIPAGGGLFKRDWFMPLLDDIPDNIESTFLTVDTAETDKTYNDATVFSFWGLYKIKVGNVESDVYGIHWIDCVQLWIEPKDLQEELMSFYNACMRFKVKPQYIAIEKKSTGVTLISNLKTLPGMRIIEIERTKAGGSKSTRFIEMQPFIASKRVTLHKFGKHSDSCVDHMSKITANDSHRYDDIADTVYDAVRMALIDGTIVKFGNQAKKHKVPVGYKAQAGRTFQPWKK
jgi:predicted phage terminase large subunit-like protein